MPPLRINGHSAVSFDARAASVPSSCSDSMSSAKVSMKESGEHWGEYCLFNGQLEEHEHLRHVNFDVGSVLLPGFACVLSVGFPGCLLH